MVADRSVREQRLGNFLRFDGVRINLVADERKVTLMEKSPIEFGELGPQNQIDETSGDADHHSRAPLTMEPEAAAEGKERMSRPLVGH